MRKIHTKYIFNYLDNILESIQIRTKETINVSFTLFLLA